MSSELRCWQCGIEPDEVVEVTTFQDLPERRYLPASWPEGDHQHEVTAPTPGELIWRGSVIADRVVANWG